MGKQVIVRSKEQYWRDYILTGLANHLGKETIKNQLLDAFRREMFDLIAIRTNIEDIDKVPETLRNKKTVENIARQARNKWVSLCIMCARFKETHGIILPSDIEAISAEAEKAEKETANA